MENNIFHLFSLLNYIAHKGENIAWRMDAKKVIISIKIYTKFTEENLSIAKQEAE